MPLMPGNGTHFVIALLSMISSCMMSEEVGIAKGSRMRGGGLDPDILEKLNGYQGSWLSVRVTWSENEAEARND